VCDMTQLGMKDEITSDFYDRVMSHIWMCHVIHMNESCHTQE